MFILTLIILTGLQTAVFSEINIDSFGTSWQLAESSATSTLSVVEGANKLNYNFTSKIATNSWVELYKTSFDELNISGSDSLSFYYKSAGNINNLKLQMYDKDGDVFDRKMSSFTVASEWTNITVPFVSMSSWTAQPGNGILNTDKITKIAIAVTPVEGGLGTVAVDNLQSYKLNTDNFLLVDSFNFGTSPNELGGGAGPWAGAGATDPIITYNGTVAKEGLYCLEITYSFSTGQYCGYYSLFNKCYDLTSKNLNFWVKSNYAGKKFKIELKDRESYPRPSVQLTDSLPAGTSTYWQEVSIPVSSFNPPVISTAVTELVFTFDQDPRAGTVYIDYVRFSTGTYSGGVQTSIDSMDLGLNVSGWKNHGKDEDVGITKTSLTRVSGFENSALQLNYEFKRKPPNIDDWTVIEHKIGLNVYDYDTFLFNIKGKNSGDHLIFRVGDVNGTVFQRKFYNITNTDNEWKTIQVPFDELSIYEKGSSSETAIDFTKLKSFHFVIEKNNTISNGEIAIDELRVTNTKKYEESRAGKLINFVEVQNNPFSPNDDGSKDKAIFTYHFSEESSATFEVLTLTGNIIYKNELGTKSPNTEYTLEWTGKDKNGDLVSNGPYFYRFYAESSNGKTDSFVHLIMVLR